MSTGLKPGVYLKERTYNIEGILGQGTFGITYLATTKVITEGNLGRMEVRAKVAIKEFFMGEVNSRREDSSEIDGSTGKVFANYRDKFRREAQNLSKLSHHEIVKVLDVFDENNTTYYVMEFIDGINLDDYIQHMGSIPEKEAICIIKGIGSALIYMHNKKMLHLDLKPKNIMMRSDGAPCLIDFGLAKQFSENGEPESSTSIGLGTPGYAPLEQANYKQGGHFPATLDVYALGATLYKMLTGARVPDASTILNDGFPENELLNAGISHNTISAIKHAMYPVAKKRTKTVVEFIDELESGNSESKDDTVYDDDRTRFETDSTMYGDNSTKFGDKGSVYEDSDPPEYDGARNTSESQNTTYSSNYSSNIHSGYSRPGDKPSDSGKKSGSNERLKNSITTILIVTGTALAIVFIIWLLRYHSNTGADGHVPVAEIADSVPEEVVVNEKVVHTVSDMRWESPLGEAIYSGEVIPDGTDGSKAVIPHGEGTARIVSGEYEGNTYQGEFNYGNMDGKANYTLKNGDVFVGRFKDNMYERGRYKFKADGKYYEGTFVNGQVGKGHWYDKNGNKI